MDSWPDTSSGQRSFTRNQESEILAAEVPAYSGTTQGPAGDAAYSTARHINVPVAADAKGDDGFTWKRVH